HYLVLVCARLGEPFNFVHATFLFFLLYFCADPRYLHSFPTRRSSDLSSHSCAFASDVAGFEAFPGKLIPIASTADAIVLAVYIPPHERGPGHEQRWMACHCSVEISPLLCCPTPSNTDTKLRSSPSKSPGSIVPPSTNTHRTSALASASIQPGISLQQRP